MSPLIPSTATRALAWSGIRRGIIIVVGSMTSSLVTLSLPAPVQRYISPLVLFSTSDRRFSRGYFSLHFKNKRIFFVCDVQFVPNVATGHVLHDLKQMPLFGDALPHLPGRIDFATVHFGGTISR